MSFCEALKTAPRPNASRQSEETVMAKVVQTNMKVLFERERLYILFRGMPAQSIYWQTSSKRAEMKSIWGAYFTNVARDSEWREIGEYDKKGHLNASLCVCRLELTKTTVSHRLKTDAFTMIKSSFVIEAREKRLADL